MFYCVYLNNVWVYMCHGTCRKVKDDCQESVLFSHMCVLGMELRLSGLEARAFIHQIVSLPLNFFYLKKCIGLIMKPRVLHMIDKYATTDIYPQLCFHIFILFIFMCVSVLSLCVYAHHVCEVRVEIRRGIGSSGTDVLCGCEP